MIDDNKKIIFSQVDAFLEMIDENDRNKVPQKLRDLYKENKKPGYNPVYSKEIPLEEQDIKREAIAMIALLHLNYWCETEEEKHKEAESTAHVLTTLNSAHTNVEGATNVFENSLGEPSKTGETASNVIEHMLDSQIVMEMVASASSSGVVDPYNVQNYMSDSDIASLESVLAEKLEQSVSANEQKLINDLAFIFGIDFSENN